MEEVYKVTIQNLDDNFLSLLNKIDATQTDSWLNYTFTLLAIICAAVSAICAWRANNSSKRQESREYFDKVIGDAFLTNLNEFKLEYKNISRLFIRHSETINDTTKEKFEEHYFTTSEKLNHVLRGTALLNELTNNDTIENDLDELGDKLFLIDATVREQPKNWQKIINTTVSEINDKLKAINDTYFTLRNSFESEKKH